MSIRIPIITDYDGKGLDKAVKEFESLKTSGEKAQFAIKKAAIPAGLAVAGLGAALADCTQDAMQDQQQQAILAKTLQNVTGATDDQVKAVENQITKMSAASGIADTEYRVAMENLTRGTKDVSKSLKDMSLVMDISKATQTDSATVADALAKAYQGNMKGLKALSPEMAQMITDGASMNDVMKVLGDTYGGTVAANAGTAAGQMEIFKNSVGEAKENIGAALLPALEKVMPVLIAFGKWAQDHTTAFIIIAGLIGGIAIAVLAVNAALKVYDAIQAITNALTAIWNVLLDANPVVLIVIGIVALIAVMVLLYNHFEIVRKVVDTLFSLMKIEVGFIIDIFTKMGDAIYGAFKFAFNGIAKLWNNTVGKISFTIPSWVPGIGGSGFSMPQIPMLANGGIVDSPTLALIGESGPEAVVPLGKGGGTGGITVNVNGGFSTSAEIGQAVVNALRAFNRQQGAASIAVTGYA